MRLIDADAMREDWLSNGSNEKVYNTNDVLDSIDEQPTVYDLDAVIATLEEYMEEYSQTDEDGMHNGKWCAMGEALNTIKWGRYRD